MLSPENTFRLCGELDMPSQNRLGPLLGPIQSCGEAEEAFGRVWLGYVHHLLSRPTAACATATSPSSARIPSPPRSRTSSLILLVISAGGLFWSLVEMFLGMRGIEELKMSMPIWPSVTSGYTFQHYSAGRACLSRTGFIRPSSSASPYVAVAEVSCLCTESRYGGFGSSFSPTHSANTKTTPRKPSISEAHLGPGLVLRV
ncbi:uncharacterized protein H6S33_004992 [Morchella sextelata]|uniref:uncharacterized protein n=1 Tax=Morchella sextelata TaxID=1174677 RepID=UPI001D0478D5|nr:uncharacterized protein H6S33_004992 [Morchella sextelata]KAH0605010.1 hypothetical protein H6S33_004992 [Morchella sextelata]